jgi:hypothetical protein
VVYACVEGRHAINGMLARVYELAIGVASKSVLLLCSHILVAWGSDMTQKIAQPLL